MEALPCRRPFELRSAMVHGCSRVSNQVSQLENECGSAEVAAVKGKDDETDPMRGVRLHVKTCVAQAVRRSLTCEYHVTALFSQLAIILLGKSDGFPSWACKYRMPDASNPCNRCRALIVTRFTLATHAVGPSDSRLIYLPVPSE